MAELLIDQPPHHPLGVSATAEVATAECKGCRLMSVQPRDEDCIDAPQGLQGHVTCTESGSGCTLSGGTCYGTGGGETLVMLDLDGTFRLPEGSRRAARVATSDGYERGCGGIILTRNYSEADLARIEKVSHTLTF